MVKVRLPLKAASRMSAVVNLSTMRRNPEWKHGESIVYSTAFESIVVALSRTDINMTCIASPIPESNTKTVPQHEDDAGASLQH